MVNYLAIILGKNVEPYPKVTPEVHWQAFASFEDLSKIKKGSKLCFLKF
jgi:hypothetical protein